MSKDHVRLLRLQAIGTSLPRSQASDAGINQSFGVIRQELDALALRVSTASEVREELERKGMLGCSCHRARQISLPNRMSQLPHKPMNYILFARPSK